MLNRMLHYFLALQHEISGAANVEQASATIVDNWRQRRNDCATPTLTFRQYRRLA
jgi:hypothetical protein